MTTDVSSYIIIMSFSEDASSFIEVSEPSLHEQWLEQTQDSTSKFGSGYNAVTLTRTTWY